MPIRADSAWWPGPAWGAGPAVAAGGVSGRAAVAPGGAAAGRWRARGPAGAAAAAAAGDVAGEGGTAPLLRATPDGLDVALDGAVLHARFTARRDWPRRAFGALGPAQAVPWLGQYWTPHLLSAGVSGRAVLGDRTL